MRPIEFRAWWKDTMEPIPDFMEQYTIDVLNGESDNPFIYSQFTGLFDKNGLTKIFEDDIIGVDGLKKGNIYEDKNLLQDKTNLIVPSITSKDWQTAYAETMGRGCRHSE